MYLRRTLDNEMSVGATLVVALDVGRHEACPYIFGGMTERFPMFLRTC
jgi:hypothetical protein